jgi:hypothetical protein
LGSRAFRSRARTRVRRQALTGFHVSRHQQAEVCEWRPRVAISQSTIAATRPVGSAAKIALWSL